MGLKKNSAGFSLMEILVSLAVFSILILVTSGAFQKVLVDWGKQRDYLDVIQNGRTAMAFMTGELRRAGSLSINGGNLKFTLPSVSDPVWYWVGDSADDATGKGDQSMLYRGTGNNINQAYDTRRELANFITANPGGDPNFDVSGSVVYIVFTFIPDPESLPGSGNRPFTLTTAARKRN